MTNQKACGIARLAILSWLLLLAGCSTVSVSAYQFLGGGHYPATDWSSIEILHSDPIQPNERLGKIELEPAGNPSVAEMEQKLKQAAAKLGANAVVIVSDESRYLGGVVTGPRWARTLDAIYGRVIVAVAIRYSEV